MIFNEHNFVFILRNTERIKKEYIMNKDSSYYLLFIIYYSLHYNNNKYYYYSSFIIPWNTLKT